MHHLILTLSANNAVATNNYRLSVLLFLLLSALVALLALASAGIRAAVNAVFRHPLRARAVIMREGMTKWARTTQMAPTTRMDPIRQARRVRLALQPRSGQLVARLQ